MFTGLVEGLGTITQIVEQSNARRITVQAPEDWAVAESNQFAGYGIGDSVAINGCCLTVVQRDGLLCDFEAGAETLSKTNLGELTVGKQVNLERALPANGRLGGHFVQGHVDGVGQVAGIDRAAEWVTMWFQVANTMTAQMVPKGSVAIDGISLTLVDVAAERFSIALIPHTLSVTTLGFCEVGDPVNIELDLLGKYVRKFLGQLQGT